MKKANAIFTILIMIAMAVPAVAASAINKDGYCKGIKFCGRVKVAEHFIVHRAGKMLEAIADATGKLIPGRDSEEVIKTFGDKV